MNKKTGKAIDLTIIALLSLSVIICIFLPFLAVFREAFVVDGSLSFSYFFDLVKDNIHLLKNSLKLGFFTTIFTTILSAILSIYIYLSKSKWQKVFLLILLITLISPPFVSSLSYFQLFGRRGWITHGIFGLSLRLYGIVPIVFLQTLGEIPLASLIFINFLNNTDPSLLVTARSFGASTNDIIKDILIPALRPASKAVMILTFFRAIADFGTPALVGGNFNVLSFASYSAVIAQGNPSKAAALNILILVPAIPAYIIYQQNKTGSLTRLDFGSTSVEIKVRREGILYGISKLVSFLILFILASLYAAIIMSAFTAMDKGRLIFTLDNFSSTLPYINTSLIRSILYSLFAAIVGSLLGLIIAYYLKIRKLKFMKFIDFSASLPYMIPGTFFGLGYLLFFSNPPLKITGTALIVLLNVTFKQLPFSTKLGNSAMDAIHPDIIDSIRDLGGTKVSEIKDAIIPLSKGPLGISFIKVFTSTMTTMGSIIFLVTPSRKLLTLVMFDAIMSGKYNVGSVLALVIILVCLIVYGIYFSLVRRRENVSRS